MIKRRHRRNEERAQGVPLATPIRSKMGPIRSKIRGKGPEWSLFGGFSYMKIPQVSLSFHQKEQNCFRHPQFYCSIAPMRGG